MALFHAQGMFGRDARKGCGSTGVDASEIARVVVWVEAALVIAAYIQALDWFARFIERLAVRIGNYAMDGHEQRARNAGRVERRGLHVAQAVGRLAEIGVLSRICHLVVALDGRFERGGLLCVEFHGLCQFVKRIGLLQGTVLQARIEPEAVEVLFGDL